MLKILADYAWPGNVRELQNCIEHVFNVIDNTSDSILPQHLPQRILDACHISDASALSLYKEYMQHVEHEFILRSLQASHGNLTETAKRLGLNRTTFWRILKRQNLYPFKEFPK